MNQAGGALLVIAIDRPRQHLKLRGGRGQTMQLLASLHLEAMLDVPQEFIRHAQFLEVGPTEMALIVELLQREQRAAGPEPRLLAAVDALQALQEKLDIANAAAVELYVNGGGFPAQRQRTAAVLTDFATRVGGSLYGGKIDVGHIDPRLHRTNKVPGQI